MKIADQRLFRKFDSFRQQVFRKKHTNKPPVPNPITPKLRLLLPLTLIFGGLYTAYQQAPSLVDLLLQRQLLTHQQLIAYRTIAQTLSCRWNELRLNPRGQTDPLLANRLYLTQLESDEVYLREKRFEKVVDYELQRNCSWWMLGLNNRESMVLLNSSGDLVERTLTSKLMIGSWRIWKRKVDRILMRQKLFDIYAREKQNIGRQCEKINSINRVLLCQEEYSKIMENCTASASKVAKRIDNLVQSRLRQEAGSKR